MRLLNVHTRQLSEFFGLQIPPYAILSHTWGAEEVSFQELSSSLSLGSSSTPTCIRKLGYLKINYACLQSIEHGLEWVWVDTCCIDKTSSAELSEAINSMYAWYQGSVVCYAYLEDMENLKPNHVRWHDSPESTRTEGRWFTRGWTLQELIAPAKVFFFGKEWDYLGDKIACSEHLSLMTGIPEDVVRSPNALRFASVASRMSWAARRETTRFEDIAYSLLGIFGVNMPLLYGEGKKSFIRLQEEILKDSDDQTIFVWDYQTGDMPERFQFRGVLADSPARFLNSARVVPKSSTSPGERPSPYSMTNKGLRIELPHGYDKGLKHLIRRS
ncbi:heterokaryon incompatibility protein-domain-containing protein [Amylocarpus encephaloides]|uniref:Heterokaryon incompatibility protein-domain-containing protein n=1 Tax=Amylocarpus encephaloides TaxID=45428 RepID=A0A9P8C2R0_9HELO|nr:heterokaryon incompatibility protein-domain-containing protein [Amylocarpus encephaloides]